MVVLALILDRRRTAVQIKIGDALAYSTSKLPSKEEK